MCGIKILHATEYIAYLPYVAIILDFNRLTAEIIKFELSVPIPLDIGRTYTYQSNQD
jgi:hypothetical protein